MKLKLNDLLLSREGLMPLANAKGLKSIVAFRISKNIKVINAEIKNYEEIRIKMIEEKASKNVDGDPIIKDGVYELSNESSKYIENELSSLLYEYVDLNINKVSLDDIEKAGLSPLEISSIEFMLEV